MTFKEWFLRHDENLYVGSLLKNSWRAAQSKSDSANRVLIKSTIRGDPIMMVGKALNNFKMFFRP